MTKNKKVVDTASKKLVKNKLTFKQKRFAKEYIETGNATEAAARVYNVKNRNVANNIGAENLAKPSVRATIQSAAEKLGITPEYVLSGFKEIKEFNAKKQKKYITIGDNTFEEEKMIDAQAALRANELLGKHLKLFVDKVEIDAKVEEKTDDNRKRDIARKLLLALKNPDILGELEDF